jgi:hypothetical protein
MTDEERQEMLDHADKVEQIAKRLRKGSFPQMGLIHDAAQELDAWCSALRAEATKP